MPILPPASAADSPRGRCAAALWPDDHPDRLALGALLPSDHLARRIDAAVARLDLTPLYAAYAGSGSPAYDPALVTAERAVMVVQVNGRVRDTIEVPATISPEEMQALALDSEKVARLLDGKVPSKIITVPPRLVNLVVV